MGASKRLGATCQRKGTESMFQGKNQQKGGLLRRVKGPRFSVRYGFGEEANIRIQSRKGVGKSATIVHLNED